MNAIVNPAPMMKASTQWASRPSDERFTSLLELNDFCQSIKDRSVSRVVSSRKLEAQPVGNDQKALVLIGPNGAPVDVTHYAFSQLAQRAGAPAGYLRDLPAPLAADCVNYGLRFHRDVENLKVLLTKPVTSMPSSTRLAELRAITGEGYGRIWDSTITQALVDRFGDGVTGDFKVPGEFGKDVAITKANTTLYASDHDLFVFLADEKHRIEMKDRRNGQPGSLARGFFVWNSEVGAASFGIGLFLFDFVCMNRIVWGMEGYEEIRIRHSAGAPDRWIEEVAPAIEAYANSETTGVVRAIEAAQAAKVDRLDEFLQKRFTKTQSTGIKAAFLADETRPLDDGVSLWDVTTAVTAYARQVQFQDERVKLEREGGRILKLAA
jgi:hypothetical protein